MVPDWRNHTLHRKVKTDLEEFQEELWERMKKEVLQSLQKPRVWGKGDLIQPGDLVLYNNDDWRPDFWPLAYVIEGLPSPDGEVRTVRIRYLATLEQRSKIKEGVHSTRNLYKLRLPPAPAVDRLINAPHLTDKGSSE